MAGNKEGGKKAAKTMKERYGDKYYKKIGRTGGHNGAKSKKSPKPAEAVEWPNK